MDLFLITVTVHVIVALQDNLLESPMVTSLDRRDYPVENLDYPGVAICNMNLISRKRANVMANKMFLIAQKKILCNKKNFFSSNITNKSKEEVLDYIKLLSGYVDVEAGQHSKLLLAHETFEQYYEDDRKHYTPYLLFAEVFFWII